MECERCSLDKPDVHKRRQHTSYDDDELNFATLCDICQKEQDEYWQERWDEYYRGCL